jgi:acetoacetyl-CoA synthetase
MGLDRPMWTPSPARIAATPLSRFVQRVGHGADSYAALHAWSVKAPEGFWPAVWSFCGVRGAIGGGPVLEDADAMPGAKWFPGARLNFADNILAGAPPEGPAIIARDEAGRRREITRDELAAQVATIAAGLASEGVVPGDRVAGILPNVPEAIAAALAASRLGAVWTSCSPDFGAPAIVDRLGQVGPKVLFACDGYRYGGRAFDVLPKVREVASLIPGIGRVVVVPQLAESADTGGVPGASLLSHFERRPSEAPPFVALPFDHPLYVVYSSGTTGVPKCIVHGQGGTLLQHLKEHALHGDVRPGDRVFYFTTLGWMMWNWLVSALAAGATLVLWDGSPTHPDAGTLWRMAAEEGVTHFGTSARYLASMRQSGVKPEAGERLRTIFSTGSPLAPESYDWVYANVKADLCLSSITGGTDLLSCFALGNPIGPVWRGEIQAPGLGMKVEVRDEDGRTMERGPGELCCARPFPSMPVGFWNDPGGARYRAAYFERFPGVWCHGDWAEWTGHGGLYVHGRSDATLNPGGVRIGTAEIYRVVEMVPGVVESIAIAQEWEGDVRVVLFVVPEKPGGVDDAMRAEIRRRLRERASPRHVPAKILEVPELPRTRSGKVVEIAVRDAVHGRPVPNLDALANPTALEHFRGRPELNEP